MKSNAQSHRASPARIMALQATEQIRERKAYARQVVESMLDTSGLPERERAFARLLTFGVVACAGTLDEIIDKSLKHPADMHDDVRDCLRISTYEIVFLKKTPYAAVDQGVELVRTVAPRAAGLANAVLRKISELAPSFPWGDPTSDVAALARQYGYPTWIVRLSIDERGWRKTQLMLEASSQETPPVFIGVNHMLYSDSDVKERFAANGVTLRQYGVPGCFIASDGSLVVRCGLLENGAALVSDAAAQLVAYLATPVPERPFLEVGSGRGTKTILLQSDCKRSTGMVSQLYALDIHEFKNEISRKRLGLFEVPGVTCVTGDATDLDTIDGLPKLFDGCLIDAPCSGLGTLRRHPEQRWRITQADISNMADIGLRILTSASRRIAPGGFMVYSTCTITYEEDERVIERFLDSKAGHEFSRRSFSEMLPDDFNDDLTSEGYFRSMPRRGGADGHFAAKLVRDV